MGALDQDPGGSIYGGLVPDIIKADESAVSAMGGGIDIYPLLKEFSNRLTERGAVPYTQTQEMVVANPFTTTRNTPSIPTQAPITIAPDVSETDIQSKRNAQELAFQNAKKLYSARRSALPAQEPLPDIPTNRGIPTESVATPPDATFGQTREGINEAVPDQNTLNKWAGIGQTKEETQAPTKETYLKMIENASNVAVGIVKQVTGITPGQMSTYYTTGPGKAEYNHAMTLYDGMMKAWVDQNKPVTTGHGAVTNRPGIGSEMGQKVPKYTPIGPGYAAVNNETGAIVANPQDKQDKTIDQQKATMSEYAGRGYSVYTSALTEAQKAISRGVEASKLPPLPAIAYGLYTKEQMSMGKESAADEISKNPAILSTLLQGHPDKSVFTNFEQRMQGKGAVRVTPSTPQSTMPALSARAQQEKLPPGFSWRYNTVKGQHEIFNPSTGKVIPYKE